MSGSAAQEARGTHYAPAFGRNQKQLLQHLPVAGATVAAVVAMSFCSVGRLENAVNGGKLLIDVRISYRM